MISSEIDTNHSQTTDSANVLSNLISSTPLHTVRSHAESIAIQALPAPLAAPAGWRSEVIHSNSPVFTSSELALVNTNTNTGASYGGYNTSSISQTAQLSSGIMDSSNEYSRTASGKNVTFGGNISFGESFSAGENALTVRDTSFGENALVAGNALHDNHAFLSEHEKRNIISRVEHQQPPPLVIRKTLPNNTVTYQQNVSVRYLQPPTPPPPGPIIIREVRPPPPPVRSPIKIQQRLPAVPTPPPLVLRERPPPPPDGTEAKIVERVLPPLPQGPRPVIVERYGPCPPKPSDVVIERWLPYKQTGQRRVLIERAAPPCIPQQEQNLLILHDGPRACIRKEFINQGVVRADPDSYMQRYGAELGAWHSNSRHAHLVDEAYRAVPPPLGASGDRHFEPDYRYCSDRYERARSPCIGSSTWERVRSPSPLLRSSSHHYSTSCYEPSYSYCRDRSYDRDYGSRRYYDDCYSRRDNYVTMSDVTSSWNRYCRPYDCDYRPSSYDSYCSSSSPRTIRVCSDDEFRRVICDLTNGHVPSALRGC